MFLALQAWPIRADTPDLAGQVTEPGTDFQVVVVEQDRTHLGIVHPFGDGDRVELRQAIAFLDHEVNAHRFQPGLERLVMMLVARPGIFQAFLLQDQQRFVQTVQVVDRRGVMIGALAAAAPVTP